MHQFSFMKKEELKKYLYFSSIHDSIIERVQYDNSKDILTLRIYNPIDRVHYQMTFAGIRMMLFINGYKWGNDNSISSLTVEENCEKIKALYEPGMDSPKEYLYLVFQMFSGNELHILLDELSIEEKEK